MSSIKTIEELNSFITYQLSRIDFYTNYSLSRIDSFNCFNNHEIINCAIKNSELIFIDINHLIVPNREVTIYQLDNSEYFFINTLTKEKVTTYNGDITTLIPKVIPIRDKYNIIIGYWNLKDIQLNFPMEYFISVKYNLPFPELKFECEITLDINEYQFQETIIWQLNRHFLIS